MTFDMDSDSMADLSPFILDCDALLLSDDAPFLRFFLGLMLVFVIIFRRLFIFSLYTVLILTFRHYERST